MKKVTSKPGIPVVENPPYYCTKCQRVHRFGFYRNYDSHQKFSDIGPVTNYKVKEINTHTKRGYPTTKQRVVEDKICKKNCENHYGANDCIHPKRNGQAELGLSCDFYKVRLSSYEEFVKSKLAKKGGAK
jgi:hypothetical protein